MSKETFEGMFKIPYQGQMRFSFQVYNGEIEFKDGDRLNDYYFGPRYVTTYDYHSDREGNTSEKRQAFLDHHLTEIKEFAAGKEPLFIIEPEFKGTLFGSDFTEKGELTIYRIYN